MYKHAMCGAGCCDPSETDKLALLEEQEKILEAKLATIRHLKESAKAVKENK